MHHYHAFGLRIASELELHELRSGQGPADVHIVYRPSINPPLAPPNDWLSVSPERVSLTLGDIHFTVRSGTSILIETFPETSTQDIRLWLLGSVMAALLHQRSYLPVHANVVAGQSGGAAAFAGDSGAGKSTMATWFHSRGHRVLTDDLCAIAPPGRGVPAVFEGIPRVKLWSDALSMFGHAPERLEKVGSRFDKYHLPLGRDFTEGSLEPLPLRRVYILAKADEGQGFGIAPLKGAVAADAILANAFRWELGQLIQPPRAQFDHCLEIARNADVFRIDRRWGLHHFEEDSVAIEQHLLTPL